MAIVLANFGGDDFDAEVGWHGWLVGGGGLDSERERRTRAMEG